MSSPQHPRKGKNRPTGRSNCSTPRVDTPSIASGPPWSGTCHIPIRRSNESWSSACILGFVRGQLLVGRDGVITGELADLAPDPFAKGGVVRIGQDGDDPG